MMMMVLMMVMTRRVTVMLVSEEVSVAARDWRTCKEEDHHCWETDSAS